MKRITFFILLLVLSSCDKETQIPFEIIENHENGTPNLSELIYNQIKSLDEHHFLYYKNVEAKSDSFLEHYLKNILQYDIDSIGLDNFSQSKKKCDSIEICIWQNKNYELSLSTYKTKTEKNFIELIKLNVDSKNEKIELLTEKNNGLEYVIINENVFHPVFESRVLGLDEAIRRFESKKCY